MPKLSNEHPPVRGKKRALALSLAKRPEGITSLEALRSGAGLRLAAHIRALKEQGHHFRTKLEGTERHARYWWLGFENGVGDGNAA